MSDVAKDAHTGFPTPQEMSECSGGVRAWHANAADRGMSCEDMQNQSFQVHKDTPQSTSDARSLSGGTDSEQQAHEDPPVGGDTDDSDAEHGGDGGVFQVRTFCSCTGFSPPRETGITSSYIFALCTEREPHLAEDR